MNYLSDKIFEVEAFYSKRYKSFTMPPHRHSYFEILYLEEGKCHVEIHDLSAKKSNMVSLSANSFIIINSGIPHNLIINEENPCQLKAIELRAKKPTNSSFPFSTLDKLITHSMIFQNLLVSNLSHVLLRDTNNIHNVITDIVQIHSQYNSILPEDKYILVQLKIFLC